jgi:protein O-GlcNAc transferase
MAQKTVTLREAFDLALRLHRSGQLAGAERLYEQILAQQPNEPDALQLLGLIAHDQGRHDQAVQLISRAVALSPVVAEYHSNLGIALRGAGKIDQASESYQRALTIKSDYADGHYNLGNALREAGRIEQAIEHYREALRIGGESASVYQNLANVFREQGLFDDAIFAYESVIRLNPSSADAQDGLGYCLGMTTRIEESLLAYRRAVQLGPNTPEYRSHLIQTLLYDPRCTRPQFLDECREWMRRHAEPLKNFQRPHTDDPSAGRPLRIGYVSANFRNHACAYYLEPLLANHDRQQFTIICYAQVDAPDEVTARLQSYVDGWNNIFGMSDDSVAELIRRDRIDILIDLNLHTDGNRLLVFARKPAPVQISWLGYPGATGLDRIDYRISDRHLDPQEDVSSGSAEGILRLADSFWCYSTQDDDLPIAPLPAAARGYITFGSTNSVCKINQVTLSLWAAALHAVKNSRLMILAHPGSHRARIIGFLQRQGIAADRVEFELRKPRRQYLELYNQLDLLLDTFPYNGETTTLDAIWMGVPPVTMVGQLPSSRAGLSLLSNLRLAHLAAKTPSEYPKIAADLCNDPSSLAELRSGLRSRLKDSPLMNGQRFARAIENAYRTAWAARINNSSVG